MFSKMNIDMPYITPFPLSEKTEWVAYPIMVSSFDKEFNASFIKAKEAIGKLEHLSQSFANKQCALITDLETDEFKKMKTSLEFSKQKGSSYSYIYSYIVMKFEKGLSFWDKTQIVSEHLDKLNSYVSSFKSDKSTEAYLGFRFDASKKYV